MADKETAVIGGVDCHLETHYAVALDQHGRRLGDHEFRATLAGYGQLLNWLRQFGEVEAIGVESTASYGAGLTRFLTTPVPVWSRSINHIVICVIDAAS